MLELTVHKNYMLSDYAMNIGADLHGFAAKGSRLRLITKSYWAYLTAYLENQQCRVICPAVQAGVAQPITQPSQAEKQTSNLLI